MHAAPALPYRRLLLGALIAAFGAMLIMRDLVGWVDGLSAPLYGALVGGSMAALATAAGTLPVLLSQSLSQRTYDAFLGLGAGIMLAATAFSLVIPAIAASRNSGAGPMAASAICGAGIVLGAALVLLMDRCLRVEGLLEGAEAANASRIKRAWIFVGAVAIHNLPEGLAIGVAFGGVEAVKAHSLATGIAIQDIPEGLVVALALRTAGYRRMFSVLLGVASGLIEPVAAVAGAAVIDVSAGLLPWGLSFAAGAMLFVICHDVVPESHRNGNCASASSAVVFGFIVMMMLDTALG